MLAFFGRLQSIDRRVIYLVMFVAAAISLIVPVTLPVIPSNQALNAFEAIEKAPTDKYALIGADWSNSTRAENGAQTYALMHHLMRRHIKFAIVGFDVQGPPNVEQIVKELAPKYGYEYGRDWVDWGFHPYNAIKATLKAMVRDMPGSMKHDINNTDLTDTVKLPIMAGLKNMDQVGLIVEITPADTYESWVAFVQGYGGGKPMVHAPTAVMAPEAYQFLDSGQMVGMLTGLKGAIEYEGMVKQPGRATKQALALSVAHVLILLLIVLGNLGYIAQKRKPQTRLEDQP